MSVLTIVEERFPELTLLTLEQAGIEIWNYDENDEFMVEPLFEMNP